MNRLLTEARRLRATLDATTLSTVATGLAGQALLVISGVIVARSLGPHDRGLFALLVATVVASTGFVSFGLPTAVAMQVARKPGSLVPALQSLRKAGWIQAAILLVVPAVAIAALVAGQNIPTVPWAGLACVTSFALLATLYALGIFQGLHRFNQFNRLRLLPILAYSAGVVILLIVGAATLMNIALVWAATTLLAAVVLIRAVLRTIPPDDGSQVDGRSLIEYGGKGLVGINSPLENFNFDQIAIGAIGGPAVLGIYVVGTAFTNLPRFIAQSLGMVVFPRVAAKNEVGGGGRIAIDALIMTILITTGVVVVLEVVVGWLVPFFFGSQFDDAVSVARILLVAAFFLSIRRVIGDSLRGANEPLAGSVAEVVSWLVFGLLIYPLTSADGVDGAAIAYTAASFASFVWLGGHTFRIRGKRRAEASELTRQ